jgi:hypothetical protein
MEVRTSQVLLNETRLDEIGTNVRVLLTPHIPLGRFFKER